jgi:enoyl-[acyl-carrier-protein] reductase (NADH)
MRRPCRGLIIWPGREAVETYDEVGNIAVFAASDWARTMTATEINFTGGAVVD